MNTQTQERETTVSPVSKMLSWPSTMPMKKAIEEFVPEGEPEAVNPYKPGSMCHQLWEDIRALKNGPAAVVAEEKHTRKEPFQHVRATFAGTTKLQPGSMRRKILDFLQSHEVQSKDPNTLSVAYLDGVFNTSTRGHLQKLIEKGHVEAVRDES